MTSPFFHLRYTLPKTYFAAFLEHIGKGEHESAHVAIIVYWNCLRNGCSYQKAMDVAFTHLGY